MHIMHDMPMDKGKSFIGTIEAAKLLHVDPTTVQRWIDARMLPSFRTPGGHRRISLQHLHEFAKDKNVPLGAPSVPARVLIVDDEPDILHNLKIRILGCRPDLDVMTADQGFKAGFSVYQNRPGLVILDIRMQGMDGIEVCKLIKRDPSTRPTTVVGITASRNFSEIAALIAAGAETVLSKPVETSELRTVLDSCFPLAFGKEAAT